MSKQGKLAAVRDPDPEAPPAAPGPRPRPATVTVTLPEGSVEMSTHMNGRDFLILHEIAELDPADRESIGRLYGPLLQMIERHIVRHTLPGGDVLDRDMPTLLQLWRGWHEAMAAAALDPTTAAE